MNIDSSCDTVLEQLRDTVVQEREGVTIRMALISCPCSRRLALVKAYKCLYCGVWFCHSCAEEHFGKTVAEYREENKHDT